MAKVKFGKPLMLEAKLPDLPKDPTPIPVETTVASTAAPSGPISGLQNVDLKPLESRLDNTETRLDQISALQDKMGANITSMRDNVNINLAKIEHSVSTMDQKTVEASPIVQPKVEQITVHKDHSSDLVEINNMITGIKNNNIKLKESIDNQKRVNIALTVCLIIITLSHLL